LKQSWAASVIIQHLLTHTHGITELSRPASFPAGTSYAYSQIGYQILADILEKVKGKAFAKLSAELFQKHNLNPTYYPDYKFTTKLSTGHSESENGKLVQEGKPSNYVAAGGFVSNVSDLARWNSLIYKGKLLQDTTYKRMITEQPNAIRNHPMFGETAYGYGVTVDTKSDILQLGLTGYSPGFCSMNFYFPDTDVSVIVLQNTAYNLDDFKKTFGYHLAILNTVRSGKLTKQIH
jgi:CubicO group peptidase (beta-lactamase class C family)